MLYGHEEEIHTRGPEASAGKPLHAAGDGRQHILHPRFQGGVLGLSLQGYTGTAAFRKLGYNTEALGFERIHNTTKRIRREARSPEGFHEGTRGGVRIPGGGNNQTEEVSAPPDEAARRMKREILCLQQQMAFLKKVMRLHGKPGE